MATAHEERLFAGGPVSENPAGDAVLSRRKRRKIGRSAAALAVLLVTAVVMAVVPSGQISPRVAPPVPPPPVGGLMWSANTETGDVSQWNQGQFGESVSNTGSGAITATDEVAHTGRYSLKMSISGAAGETQAARILRWNSTPQAGYYSVWLYFPAVYRPARWWNVIQFKSVRAGNVPVLVLNVGNRPDGTMYFYLWDALTRVSYPQLNRVNIPIKTWTHVELYLSRSTHRSGRITVWQDGVLLFDVDQIQTAVGPNIQWGIGNYTDDITPPDPVIYADDAEIRSVSGVDNAESRTSAGSFP